METPVLLSTLEDTQASLATALARIEAYRIREKFLLQENYRLREELRKTDGVSLETALQSTLSHRYRTAPQSDSTGEESAVREFQSREGINYRLHEEYPIVLYTKKGKVPASLSATPDCIEVFESKARIGASQFVGMTNLSGTQGRSPKLVSKSWTSYLFGKSKGTEDMISPRRSRPDRRSLSPAPAPHLQRRSWDGSTDVPPDESQERPPEPKGVSSVWQVLWKDGGGGSKLKQLVFEASVAAQAFINRQIEAWSDAASRAASVEEPVLATQSNIAAEPDPTELEQTSNFADEGMVVPPKHLIPNGPFPGMAAASGLLNEELVRCITSAVPPRFRHCTWNLLYSTDKHGFSLQTLYRKAAGVVPTVMVMRDMSDFVFGCYCSEAWKMGHRFYGTGETFIFQLEPHRVCYPWKQDSTVRNNFFMFGSTDSLGVGGTGHFAIWLDSELLYGSSGLCDTFGSPCIASKEEFKILKLELWGLS